MDDNLLINMCRFTKQHVLLFLAAPRSLESTKATALFNWPNGISYVFFPSRRKRALTSREPLERKIVSSQDPEIITYIHSAIANDMMLLRSGLGTYNEAKGRRFRRLPMRYHITGLDRPRPWQATEPYLKQPPFLFIFLVSPPR